MRKIIMKKTESENGTKDAKNGARGGILTLSNILKSYTG